MRRLTREQLWTMEEMFRGGALVTDIQERVGVSHQTIFNYVKKFEWSRPVKIIPRFDEPRACAKCHRVFPATWFKRSSSNLSGRRSDCKLCWAVYARAAYHRKRGVRVPEIYDEFTAQQIRVAEGLLK